MITFRTTAHRIALATAISGVALSAGAQPETGGSRANLALGQLMYESWLNYAAGEAGCHRGSENERTACANQRGYSVKFAMQSDCMFTVTDRVPRPASLRTDWEGKVTQTYVLARELTIPLRELDRSLIIRTMDNKFSLYFEIRPDSPRYRKALLSSAPDKWFAFENPPTAVDVTGGAVGSDEHYEALLRLQADWARKNEFFDGKRGPDLPFITVSRAFENDWTNSTAGLQLIQNNRERVFLKYQTLSYNEPKRTAAVDLIRTVLKECPQQE